MDKSISFKNWLENIYITEKFQRPLSPLSANGYVSGIHSLNRKLKLRGDGIFSMTTEVEFKEVEKRMEELKIGTKDEVSHFRAYKKFNEFVFKKG